MDNDGPLDFASLARPTTKEEKALYKDMVGGWAETFPRYRLFLAITAVIYAVIAVVQGWLSALMLLPFAVVVWALLYFFVRSGIRMSAFKRFAKANGFTFVPQAVPQEQGNLFQIGHSRYASPVIQGSYKGHPFWFGNYVYTVRRGKSSYQVILGVLNVTLPRAVPYVLIDGRQNTIDAAAGIDRSQQLQLEGDFGKYFTVYCPKDYERDVLYFLTPELMQVLTDMHDKFDAEIVGNELYFYTKKPIKPEAADLQELFKVIETVGGEIVENTKRYQDYRIDKKLGTVAASGLVLKKSIWPAVVTIVFILLYLLSVIDDFNLHK